MRCECLGCKNHDDCCLNLDGQLSLLSDDVIRVVTYQGRALCDRCTPKPVVLASNLHACRSEAARLRRQESLFLFF